MKKLFYSFAAVLLLASCKDTVAKNKKSIDDLVETRAVSRSVTIESYHITNKEETPDSLILYVDVKPANGQPYSDTLRVAKTPDGYIKIVKNN